MSVNSSSTTVISICESNLTKDAGKLNPAQKAKESRKKVKDSEEKRKRMLTHLQQSKIELTKKLKAYERNNHELEMFGEYLRTIVKHENRIFGFIHRHEIETPIKLLISESVVKLLNEPQFSTPMPQKLFETDSLPLSVIDSLVASLPDNTNELETLRESLERAFEVLGETNEDINQINSSALDNNFL